MKPPALNPVRIDGQRLQQVLEWSLKHGAHKANDTGDMCVMEAVAYVAGEPWSDHPVDAARGDAAWYAAEDAALAAALDATGDAARTAARDALKPTTERLQASALNLVHRMLEVAE